MEKIIVRQIGVASFAQLMGAAQAMWGFVVGLVALFSGISAVVAQENFNMASKVVGSVGVVLFCLVVIPLIAFLFGWLYGVILSLVANLFLHTSHGIELDIDNKK